MIGNEYTFSLLTMVGSLSALVASSHVAIKNTVRISQLTDIETSRIGLTLVAISTSLPELAVAISSAISGTAAVSIGNVLGSNVANVCLVVGLGLLLASLKHGFKLSAVIPAFKAEELDLLYFGLLIASAVPIILVSLLPASSLVGILLIALFLYYIFKVILRKDPSVANSGPKAQVSDTNRRATAFTAIMAILGVVISADFLVHAEIRLVKVYKHRLNQSNLSWRPPVRRDMGLIFVPIAASLMQLAISRGREYGADEGGTRLIGRPLSLGSALEKIERAVRSGYTIEANPATSPLWIANPFSGDSFAELFMTHPATRKRIERLNRIEREING